MAFGTMQQCFMSASSALLALLCFKQSLQNQQGVAKQCAGIFASMALEEQSLKPLGATVFTFFQQA